MKSGEVEVGCEGIIEAYENRKKPVSLFTRCAAAKSGVLVSKDEIQMVTKLVDRAKEERESLFWI